MRSTRTVGLVIVVVVGVAAALALAATARRGDGARDLASARALAFASRAELDRAPERALLLALEACRRACDAAPEDTYAIRDSLLTALQRAARLTGVLTLEGTPRALAYSHDGRLLAASTFDDETQSGAVVVHDLGNGTMLSRPASVGLDDLAFTSDDARIVGADSTGIRTFDARTLAEAAPRLVVSARVAVDGTTFEDDIGAVFLSPDGRLAGVTGTHGAFNVWDLGRRERLRGFDQSRFSGGVFSPDGTTLAASGFDDGSPGTPTRVALWSMRTGREIRATRFAVDAVSFSGDSTVVALASAGGVRLWDTGTGHDLRDPLRGAASEVAVDLTGTRVAVVVDGALSLWNLTRNRARRVAKAANGIRFGPHGRTLELFVGGRYTVVDGARGAPLPAAPNIIDANTLTAYAPDEHTLVSAHGDGVIRLWTLEPRHPLVQRVVRIAGDPLRPEALAWSPDGTRLVVGAWDGVRIGGVDAGVIRRLVVNPEGLTLSVDVDADGTVLVVSGGWSPVELRNPRRGPLRFVPNADWSPTSAAFVDGGRTVAALAGHRIRFWDVAERRLRKEGYDTPGADEFAIAPDGGVVVTADVDGSISIRRVREGRLEAPMEIHRPPPSDYHPEVYSLDFNADGSVLVAAAADDSVRLFDGRSGLPLGDPLVADGAAAISPADNTLATGNGHEISIWDSLLLSTDLDAWEHLVCAMTGRGLTRPEWQRLVGDARYRDPCRP